MKTAVVIFGFLVTVSTLLGSPNAQELEAASYYKDQEYLKAQKQYEELIAQFPENPDLHYNLANTYYQQSKYGLAILHYRKALRFSPGFDEAKHNLELARGLVVNQEVFDDMVLVSFVKLFLLSEWFGAILFVGFLLLLTITVKNRLSEDLFKNLVGIFLGLLICFIIVFSFRLYVESYREEGVILASSVEVRSGPSDTLSTLFIVHEGLEVEILNTLDDWVQIKLANGFQGWVLDEFVASI